MPTDTPSITAKIAARLKVHITALEPDFKLEQPVYALNWFDSRSLWLYNFYNFLAARSVLKVGGVPFFKARVDRTLYGNVEARRDVLLIVRYPSVENFKTMLENRYFQLVSLIRSLAVKQFTFGFSNRTDIQDNHQFDLSYGVEKRGVYAIHHYQIIKNDVDIIDLVRDIVQPFDVELTFSSQVSARLYSQKGDQASKAIDTIMDACIILQAASDKELEKLLNSTEYQALIATTQCSFVATLNRIF